MGRHRAENQPDGQSTSERMQGKRDDASQGKHRDPEPETTGSDLPTRNGGEHPGNTGK